MMKAQTLMALRLNVLVFMLVFAWSPVSWAQDTSDERRFMVVIGVERYTNPGWEDLQLKFSCEDAQRLGLLLHDRYGFEFANSGPLLNPTSGQVIDALADLARLADENDTVLVYFSGHGFSLPGGEHYLACRDTSIIDPIAARASAVSTTGYIGSLFERLQAKNKIFILDACWNEVWGAGQAKVKGIHPAVAPRTTTAFLRSCTPGEKSVEGSNGGLFTNALIAKLKEKGDRDEAFTDSDFPAISVRVAQEAFLKYEKHRQTPDAIGSWRLTPISPYWVSFKNGSSDVVRVYVQYLNANNKNDVAIYEFAPFEGPKKLDFRTFHPEFRLRAENLDGSRQWITGSGQTRFATTPGELSREKWTEKVFSRFSWLQGKVFGVYRLSDGKKGLNWEITP